MNRLATSLFILLFNFCLVNLVPVVVDNNNDETYNEKIIYGDIMTYRKALRKNDLVYHSAISADADPRVSTWPNGEIPFVLDEALQPHKCLIYNGMLQIMLNSCVKFREKTPDDRLYVKIFQNPKYDVCYGTLGCNHVNPNEISIGNGCLNIGTVVHELMHSLGFYHLQNRHDRDQYLRVFSKNIESDKKYNFERNNASKEVIFTPWDFDSVMLYGKTAFSRDGHSFTMKPRNESIVMRPVYQKPGLSRLDSVQIRQLYNCPRGFRGQNFHKNPHLISWFVELTKTCSETSPFSLYLFI